MPRRPRRRRWLVAAGVVVVLVVVGGIVAYLRLRTESTPVTVEDAVAEFEEGQGTASTSGPATSGDTVAPVTSAAATTESVATSTIALRPALSLPVAGVYAYTTTGGEDLRILSNPSRTYPAETPLVVEPAGCGVVVRWTPLVEREETWQMCVEGEGLALVGYTSVHDFFGQRESRVLTCEPGGWLIPPPEVPDESVTTCSGSGLVEQRTTRVVDRSPVDVGGEQVEAISIEVAVATSGTTTGTTVRRLTMAAASGLPIRWADEVANSTETAVGAAAYSERLELVAVALAPL